MKRQVIKKNRHFVTLLTRMFGFHWKPLNKIYEADFEFTDAIYDLNSKDQGDWNKLWGLDFESPFSTRTNTLMVGWRWNLTTKLFELCQYTHLNGDRKWSKEIFTVKPKEKFRVSLFPTKNHWATSFVRNPKEFNYDFDLALVRELKPATKNFKWATEINLYFGGNRKAPKDVIVRRTKTKRI